MVFCPIVAPITNSIHIDLKTHLKTTKKSYRIKNVLHNLIRSEITRFALGEGFVCGFICSPKTHSYHIRKKQLSHENNFQLPLLHNSTFFSGLRHWLQTRKPPQKYKPSQNEGLNSAELIVLVSLLL